MKKVLTIAGSDSSGGAGIQADIKTITVQGMFAMSVITALTAQNTMGVFAVQEATAEFVSQQMECVFEDIRPDAVKIGMVSSIQIIEVIAKKLLEYDAKNIVLDPVMVATSGGKLMRDGAVDALVKNLIPIASLITPNIQEAEILADMKISDTKEMKIAAEKMAKLMDCDILIKGGHLEESSDDLLFTRKSEAIWFNAEKIDNANTHGTGCTLSSAIACGLADGLSMAESVRRAKDFVNGAIGARLDIGHGRGPLNHMYQLR